ncbi:MAG: hypothetical protein LAO18_06125 [Acidobacteriia bacterium]|nr:hypothetical protein [Terriglobia bacterium]
MKQMRLALLVAAMAWIIPPTSTGQAVPDTKEWGDKFNTPGATLVLKKTGQDLLNGHTAVAYSAFASGLPKDRHYALWTWIVGSDPQPVADAYINNDGRVVNVLGDSQHQVAEDPIDLKVFAGKGEPKKIALISDDGQLHVFAQAVPFPIEASDGPCRISGVMEGPAYEAVAVFVTGLQPKEDLLVDTQSESENAQNKAIATEGGTYNSLILPFVKGKPSGKASFRVTGKSCKVGIAFPWGAGSYQLQ